MLTNTKEMNWKSARRFGNTAKYALLVFIAHIASKRINYAIHILKYNLFAFNNSANILGGVRIALLSCLQR